MLQPAAAGALRCAHRDMQVHAVREDTCRPLDEVVAAL